ncbi:MAG: FMN-binding protein [Bacillota bacterium]|nr:FMN-binding protein [Bacillota bacterium]
MKKGLTSGLVLLVLGMIAGLLLGVVNAVTAPIIAANELRERLTALEVFYPDINTAYDVTEVIVDENGIESIYVLKTKGTDTVVAAVYGVAKMGYKSDVSMLIAVKADGTVEGYAFIGTGGTEGLGLVLGNLDFGMTDALVGDDTAFDAVAGASVTSGGVLACFEAVAARIAAEGLGV